MKRNDIKALATKTTAELQTQLVALEAEITKAQLAKIAGKLANVRQVAMLRDDLARIKTVLRQQQLGSKIWRY